VVFLSFSRSVFLPLRAQLECKCFFNLETGNSPKEAKTKRRTRFARLLIVAHCGCCSLWLLATARCWLLVAGYLLVSEQKRQKEQITEKTVFQRQSAGDELLLCNGNKCS